MGDELKNRENRLRRVAARRMLVLRKARRRDPGAWDHGMYTVAGPDPGTAAFSSRDLDAVEAFLAGYDAKAVLGS